MPAFMMNAGTLAGVYRTPAIHVDITGVFSNTNPMRPYRGNGRPEAAYVIERMVELAADQLGMDPAELRRRNYVAPSQMPFKTGLNLHLRLAASSRRTWTWRWRSPTAKGFEKRKSEAEKRGKLLRLRPVQHHRARRRASTWKAPKCASTATAA